MPFPGDRVRVDELFLDDLTVMGLISGQVVGRQKLSDKNFYKHCLYFVMFGRDKYYM
jgi:hypothetical protein